MKQNWLGNIILGALFGAMLIGCSGKTVVESDLNIEDAPEWVNEGTNFLKTKGGRLFHGVGSASTMDDFSLQKSTADNRARAEVARILSSYMKVVSSDYTASGKNGDDKYSEQNVSREINNITELNMAGVKIIANWRNKKGGVIYSLAELDMESVKDIVKNIDSMNTDLGKYISSHGNNIFDRAADGKQK
jgi:hypothetical protein